MDDDTLAKFIILPLCGLLFLAMGLGFFLVVRDSIRGRGRWGVNSKPVRCPECDEPAPVVRVPKNLGDALGRGHLRPLRLRVRQMGTAAVRVTSSGPDRRVPPTSRDRTGHIPHRFAHRYNPSAPGHTTRHP